MQLLFMDSNSMFHKKCGCRETLQCFCQPLRHPCTHNEVRIVVLFRKDILSVMFFRIFNYCDSCFINTLLLFHHHQFTFSLCIWGILVAWLQNGVCALWSEI